uniref:Uncharacterized protein n=1 Tax=Trichobilharzia regenti TaxID=157069 RepID=A0AA85KJB3_TRIRE|nr:unnamed protein product [Trichobilharzia regenti]
MEVLNRVDSLCEDITTELNALGECIYEKLSDISWKFEEIECVTSKVTLFNENKLMLDEAYFPNENATANSSSATTTTSAWDKVAAGAAAYAHKTIGSKYSQPVRHWLTNAASTAVQYGLLARYSTGINVWTPEGNWFSGKWTSENTASAEELRCSIDPSMSTLCINVIIAGILNYCQSNCYTPKNMSNYALQLLHNGSMEKFGISNENDKLLIMEITSQWCSRIKIIQLIESVLKASWDLKAVSSIGQCKLQLTPQIKEYFDFLPINWKDIHPAVCIAHKLVKSNCIYFADFHRQLIDVKIQLNAIQENPFKYHCDCKYLLKNNDNNNHDNNNKPKVENHKLLFGRLITFLKYAEPHSQLFQQYKCLKCNGKTCEKQYSDYNKNWELIVQHIYSNNEYSASSMMTITPIEEIIKKLQELKLISNNFKIDEASVSSVREAYQI